MKRGKTNRVLDGVRIRTDRSGCFCGTDCPLLVYINGTCCALEADKARARRLRSRYNKETGSYERCPLCLRRERKPGTVMLGDGSR